MDIAILKGTVNTCDISCDICLCLPNAKLKKCKVNTKIAILYGDIDFSTYKKIKFKQLITYGMSSKNTITPSSITDDNILIAIQRDIKKINGNKLSISEIKVKKNNFTILELVAHTTLNLILD